MKKLNLLLLTLFACLVACKKDKPIEPPIVEEGIPVIYTAGMTVDATGKSKPCYWKNNIITLLSMPETAYGVSNTIIQKDKDIYVCGSYNNNGNFVGCVWKNGVKQDLTPVDGYPRVSPTKMFISGNDVYVTGSCSNGFDSKICYWKNGGPTVLTDVYDAGAINGTSSIWVTGNDIYITGLSVKRPSIDVASYWKNGTRSDLTITHTTKWSRGKTIKFTNNTLYAGGYAYDVNNTVSQAMIWKNGMGQVLPTLGNASVEDLDVNNSDVYAVGWYQRSLNAINEACYWKNNAIVPLETQQSSQSQASSIHIDNSDIYIAGTIRSTGSRLNVAVYWKNGTLVQLPNPSGNKEAGTADIFIGRE